MMMEFRNIACCSIIRTNHLSEPSLVLISSDNGAHTRLVLKTLSITATANVKLEYEIGHVLSLKFFSYLMRPIRSKLCALSHVLIFVLQLSMFTVLWIQI